MGFAMPSNSATPPFVMPVFDWFAITSRSFATVESVRSVWGSAPVAVVMSWPRKPTTPGTAAQLSFAVIRPVFVQACAKGSSCGEVFAAAGSAPMSSTSAAAAPSPKRPRIPFASFFIVSLRARVEPTLGACRGS